VCKDSVLALNLCLVQFFFLLHMSIQIHMRALVSVVVPIVGRGSHLLVLFNRPAVAAFSSMSRALALYLLLSVSVWFG
jgi:hypothetical protein